MSGQSSMEGQLRTLSSLSLQPDAAYRPALLYKFYLSNFPTHELIYLENHLRFVQILEKNTFTNFYYIKHSWESSSGVKHVNKFPLFEKQIKQTACFILNLLSKVPTVFGSRMITQYVKIKKKKSQFYKIEPLNNFSMMAKYKVFKNVQNNPELAQAKDHQLLIQH